MSRTSSRRRSPASRPDPVPTVPSGPRQHELITKRRGELAELAFAYKATHLGFGVSKPFGDSERYDNVVDPRELIPRRPSRKKLAPKSSADAPDLRGVRRVKPAANHPHNPVPPLWRVQVKCSTQLLNGLYRTNAHRRTGGRAVPYLPGEIDFIAAYIIPEDTWYIIPLAAIRGRTSLLFRRAGDPRPGLYDAYYEAWHLLRPRMTTCPHCAADTPIPAPKPEPHPQRPRNLRKPRKRATLM